MKQILALAVAALLCAGCAAPPASSASGSGSSITMYGTIDEGITVRR